MRANPIDIDEFAQLVMDRPGIKAAEVQKYFDCDASRYTRAMVKLRNIYQPFEQLDQGSIRLFDADYARDNDIPKKILSVKIGMTEYRRRNRERKAKHDSKMLKLNQLDLHLLLIKLWPGNTGLPLICGNLAGNRLQNRAF